MSMAIKRENDLVTIVGTVGAAFLAFLGVVYAALTGGRNEFVKDLARELGAVRERVGHLEDRVELLTTALDLERETSLLRTAERDAAIIERDGLRRERDAAISECNGLRRDNVSLTERNVLLTARNLELEVAMAGRASEEHRKQGGD